MPAYDDQRFVPFLAAMREAPGSSTHLLVAADWLDEHEQPALATAVRKRAPVIAGQHQRAIAVMDALLALDVSSAKPVPMPEPERGHYRSRQQWVRTVRAALRPFRLPHLTVAASDGWHGGPDVEIRVPCADFGIGDGRGSDFLVPWCASTSELIRAGTLAFGELMPRLFPGEPARTVNFDGVTTRCAFWRVTARNH